MAGRKSTVSMSTTTISVDSLQPARSVPNLSGVSLKEKKKLKSLVDRLEAALEARDDDPTLLLKLKQKIVEMELQHNAEIARNKLLSDENHALHGLRAELADKDSIIGQLQLQLSQGQSTLTSMRQSHEIEINTWREHLETEKRNAHNLQVLLNEQASNIQPEVDVDQIEAELEAKINIKYELQLNQNMALLQREKDQLLDSAIQKHLDDHNRKKSAYIETLEDQNQRLKNRIQELTDALDIRKNIPAPAVDVNEQVAILRSNNEDLTRLHDELSEQLRVIRISLNGATDEASRLRGQNNSLNETVKNIMNELTASNNRKSEQDALVHNLRAEVEETIIERDNYLAQCRGLENTLKELQNQLDRKERESHHVGSTLHEAQEQLVLIRAQNLALREQLTRLEKIISELEVSEGLENKLHAVLGGTQTTVSTRKRKRVLVPSFASSVDLTQPKAGNPEIDVQDDHIVITNTTAIARPLGGWELTWSKAVEGKSQPSEDACTFPDNIVLKDSNKIYIYRTEEAKKRYGRPGSLVWNTPLWNLTSTSWNVKLLDQAKRLRAGMDFLENQL